MAWNEPGNNGRDPWGGGNRNNQGPPDLDEVVKKLQQGLGGLFGKSGGSGGGSDSGDGPGFEFSGKMVGCWRHRTCGLWRTRSLQSGRARAGCSSAFRAVFRDERLQVSAGMRH